MTMYVRVLFIGQYVFPPKFFHTRSINYELICTTEIRWYRAPSTSCNNVALYSLALYIQRRKGEKTTEKNRRACADLGGGLQICLGPDDYSLVYCTACTFRINCKT